MASVWSRQQPENAAAMNECLSLATTSQPLIIYSTYPLFVYQNCADVRSGKLTCHCVPVDIWGQLCGVSSFLTSWDTGFRLARQVSFLTEPSCLPSSLFFFLTRPPVTLPNSPFHSTHVAPWLASLLKTHFLCSLTNLSQFCGPGETTLDTMWNEGTQRKEEECYSVLSLTKSAHLWEQTASVTCCVTSHLSVRCTHLLMWSVGGLEDFLQIAWNFLSWCCLD